MKVKEELFFFAFFSGMGEESYRLEVRMEKENGWIRRRKRESGNEWNQTARRKGWKRKKTVRKAVAA